jgi:hypothetical protein
MNSPDQFSSTAQHASRLVRGILCMLTILMAASAYASVGMTGFGVSNLDQHGITGSWYNPATSGQGFEVEVFPDLSGAGQGLFYAGWFTYDVTASGGRRWYAVTGGVSNSNPTATLGIYPVYGGNFNAPPVVSASASTGTATWSMSDCNTGTFTYAFTDGSGRTGSIPISRLTPNVTCTPTGDNSATPGNYLLSGNWYDPNTSGQGFIFDVSPSISNLFAAWYTFLPHGQQTGGPPSQEWYTIQVGGFLNGSTSISNAPIYETSGGIFNNPQAVSSTQVGTANITFTSCAAMTLAYNFTGGVNQGLSGSINLQRIGPTPAGCSL